MPHWRATRCPDPDRYVSTFTIVYPRLPCATFVQHLLTSSLARGELTVAPARESTCDRSREPKRHGGLYASACAWRVTSRRNNPHREIRLAGIPHCPRKKDKDTPFRGQRIEFASTARTMRALRSIVRLARCERTIEIQRSALSAKRF